MKYTKDTYAIFGYPLEHSISPLLHAYFAKQTEQNLDYIKIPTPPNTFQEKLAAFFAAGGKGANVTMPDKSNAYQAALSHSDYAKLANVANTLVRQDEHWHADNTDGPGLIWDLSTQLNIQLDNKKVLVLGAGGAAQGIIPALLKANIAELVIANRTLAKAEAIIDLLKDTQAHNAARLSACIYQAIPGINFDLIINSTDSSLAGYDLPLPEHVFNDSAYCYDLMYSSAPHQTRFLTTCVNHGVNKAQCFDGFGMLVGQAVLSFQCWHDIKPLANSHNLNELRQLLK